MTKTFGRILGKIAPEGMSSKEYVLRCALTGIDASPDSPAFVEWLVGEALRDDGDLHAEVGELLAEAIEKGELLDFKRLSGDGDERMASVLSGCVLCRNGAFRDRLYEAVLRTAPRKSATWNMAFRLNKAFGFTSVCYFVGAGGEPADGLA